VLPDGTQKYGFVVGARHGVPRRLSAIGLQIIPGIGQPEAFIDKRKIGHDVFQSRVFKDAPIGK
jgi:hypothetical protein